VTRINGLCQYNQLVLLIRKLISTNTHLDQKMNSISRSIAQTIAPAVRRAASTAAPAAAQSAKEGLKLVQQVCALNPCEADLVAIA
jgi:hypothetical protein